MKTKMNTRMLATTALLAAISVVLARFIIPMPNSTTRFSIEAVPIIIAGYLFGPVPGAIVGLVADTVGCLFSGYGYNPMLSVPPIMIGVCAGCLRFLLYKRVTFLNILVSFLPAVILGSILWQSYWLSFFYGSRSFVGFLGVRTIQFAITSLINAVVIRLLFQSHVFTSMRLWPPARARASKENQDDK